MSACCETECQTDVSLGLSAGKAKKNKHEDQYKHLLGSRKSSTADLSS